MSEEGGFEVASAYVQVSPNTDTFAAQLEGELGALDYVIQVPVVADASGLAGDVQAQADAAKAEVTVPVVPDTEGFQVLIDQAAEEAKTEVTVPVVPDAAGFAPALDEAVASATESATAEAAAGGEAAGAAFSEKFSAAAEGAQLFPAAAAERDAEVAAEDSAAGFGSKFSSLLANIPLLGGLMGGAEAEAAAGGAVAGESFMGKLKGVIAGDLPAMEVLLGAGFVAATAVMATHFQSAMELIHTQAGVAQSAIAGLSGQVLSLAGQVGESPTSLAQALYHVESAFQSSGITGQKAMEMVRIAAEGARTGSADLVDVQNALDAAVVAGIPGVNNLSQAMGALNAIVGSGDMHMQDLADAMGTGAIAQAKLYGQSLTEVGAALAVFGDNNIRGAKAATDLRMTWQAIQSPLKAGDAALAHLGLTSTQLADTMTHHGLTAAIGEFIAHLEASKVPVADWGQYVTEIFGKRAGTGIGVLVEQYTRLQQKLKDITDQSHTFGSAWEATQQTAAQKAAELRASFDALMIKIGNGLLPAITSFLDLLNRNLPAIEHFGASLAHLAAPVVTSFFTGLEAILKVLFGPLKDVTLAVGGLTLAFLALDAVNPFLGIAAALVTLVGLIIKYHEEIFATIRKYWHDIEIFLAGVALAIPIVAMLAAIVAAVVKYHQDIFNAIKAAWDAIVRFFDTIRNTITSGFDTWWASHGKEVAQVWAATWDTIKTTFSAAWDYISTVTKVEWQAIMDVLKPGMDLLNVVFKTGWDAIQAIVKTAWDLIAAAVKIALAGIESVIKIAWDVIVGIFNVALDLITGHWSKAWTDLQKTGEQVWNAIKAFLQTTLNAILAQTEQVVNNLVRFLTGAWASIKSGVVSAFTDVKNTIIGIWDDILSAIESIVSKIKSVISSISAGGVASVAGKVLSSIGLASGGMVPGPDMGRDTMLIPMRGGEGVLIPEAVRGLGGPGFIHAANARFRGRGFADGGVIPGYAGGGVITPNPVPQMIAAGILDVLSQIAGTAARPGTLGGYTGPAAGVPQPYGGQQVQAGGNTFNLYFSGTQWPNAEQQQALMHQLSAMVGVS